MIDLYKLSFAVQFFLLGVGFAIVVWGLLSLRRRQ